MKLLGFLISVACTITVQASASTCKEIDPELIHCPPPEAPRVTELRSGKVTLELSISPDGRVTSSTVLSISGHSAWSDAAQAAVAQWRYPKASAPRTRVVPLEFQLADR